MNEPYKPTVGVAIMTHKARYHLPYCIPAYTNSAIKPRVLVVNSSSFDGTVEVAQTLGAETLVIPRKDFNHGTSRELARKTLGTDIVVMATPDAYPAHSDFLEYLIQPLIEKRASITYAKQIPHKGADFFEAFARHYNYPPESHTRSIADIKKYGVYTFFCSNSCAAYLNEALDEIGGFEHVLLGEDTVATAKLLLRDHQIAYVAEARVHHSHRYSLGQEFRRNFDIGLARQQYRHLISVSGKDSKRGKAYAFELMRHTWLQNRTLLPYAFLQTLTKWMGYQLGKRSNRAPLWWKRALSSQDFYWK